eukprot:UN13334
MILNGNILCLPWCQITS